MSIDFHAQQNRFSYLHDLTDAELQEIVDLMRERLKDHKGEIVEQDRWTVWSAMK